MRIPLSSRQFFSFAVLAVVMLLGSSCDSDDAKEETGPDVFWQEAKLIDFPLAEVEYLDIEITHPEITDGVETKPGKILVKIPYLQESLNLSLKQFDLDQGKYNITPGVGEQQDFSPGPVTYTISDVSSSGKAIHYEVTILHGGEPLISEAKITGFKFEKEKNPMLESTIEAKIVEYFSEYGIFVIVPDGTNFTQLTPTIAYEGTKLYYKTDDQFTLYPQDDLTVDFKYPKLFSLQVENSRGVKSKPYQVIVDVSNPIQFESPIVTANVKAGNGTDIQELLVVAKWTNRGNYPIDDLYAVEYKNKTYPIANYTGDANIITASIKNPQPATAGVLPGETGDINVRVKRTPVTGLFTTTAVFTPVFSFAYHVIVQPISHDAEEQLYLPQSVRIETTIEN